MPVRVRAAAALLALAWALPVMHPGGAWAIAASAEPSAFAGLIAWIFEQQRQFHRELTAGLRGLAADGGVGAAWGLIAASFAYGVFHAAGPGHGKAILAAYLLSHRERALKGAALGAAGALCQGLMAIGLVYGLIELAGWLPRDASAATLWSERLSYVLVLLVGAMLAVRAARGLAAGLRPGAVAVPAPGAEGHTAGGHECGCGHAHAPSPDQVDRATTVRTTLGLILSIGLRPCSGAVLVLVFANIMNLAWAGIAAVAVLSPGTALATASLAILAVNARRWAAALAGRGGLAGYRAGAGLVALGGGLLVMALGVTLIMASFAPPHPLGMP